MVPIVGRTERRPGTGPGTANGAVGLVMLLLMAVVALTARQPPPPSIAEFAPQAVEQIKDAPAEQSSDFGSGEGGGDGGTGSEPTSTTTSTAAPVAGTSTTKKQVIDKARVRRCVGDPPRQIEDPQSPPCVAYWEGDNGGRTSKGVERNEIRIAVPDAGDEDARLQAFFNNRFEFYGRKLVLINTRDDFAGNEVGQQQAAAQKADGERRVFASTDATFGGGFYYYEELAKRKILSAGQRSVTPEAFLQSKHPYMWQYESSTDEIFATTGDWACARLWGRPAKHSTDPVVGGRTRTIGVVLTTDSPQVPLNTKPFTRELAKCGGTVKVEVDYAVEGQDPSNAADAALRMKAQNVSTVVCFCDSRQMALIMNASLGQAYRPEWVGTSYGRDDYNFFIKVWQPPASQTDQLFGLTFRPRQVRASNEPVSAAMSEVSPGSQPTNSIGMSNLNIKYRSLLLLASGIQMAGPNLTPKTFADALHKTVFPNPPHPNQPGKVGFLDRDHTMTEDATEWWWTNNGRSPYADDAGGTICYVRGGERHTIGGWPPPDELFNGTCDSGA
jgi:hypothetical protein